MSFSCVFSLQKFGSGNRVQKEKQFFENRFQRSTPPSSMNKYPASGRQINPDRFNRNYSPGISYDHKPYNYLLNDRKDPRASLSGGAATFNNFKTPKPINQNDYEANNYYQPPRIKTESANRQPPMNYTLSKPYYDVSGLPMAEKMQRINGFQYGVQQVKNDSLVLENHSISLVE